MSQGAHLSPELQKLITLIRERTGNVIPQSRYTFLEELAQRRAQSRGFAAVDAYVESLETGALRGEWDSLVPLVTIKESYFFRAPQQFETIRSEILPKLLAARAETRQLRIWSAACARGEEPATLAMLLDREKALAGWSWSILATDVDEEALAGARLGLYGERAVAQVPPELLARYFSRRGKLLELRAEIRERIVYRPLNLAHPPFDLPFPGVDLILLRNVLIYFRRPLQRKVVAQASRFLAPHGFLFLGASETLWQIQGELEPVDLGSCFTYRHRQGPEAEEPAPPRRVPTPPARPHVPLRTITGGEVAARSVSIVVPGAPVAAPPPRSAHPVPAPPPEPTPLPPCSIQERLMNAGRSLAGNQVAEAGRILGEVLTADPSEPAAHALEGFLHDLTGRTDEAVASYRAALYLEPALFQVRILLADCLLRLGNRDRAEHHYREVLAHLASGRERNLPAFADLPFPDRTRAQKRCRQVLGRG